MNDYLCLKNVRTQGKADTINLEQLITFLNEKQRDPTLNEILYPLYDEKRALEIINDYEQNEVARNESKNLIDKLRIHNFDETFFEHSLFSKLNEITFIVCKEY